MLSQQAALAQLAGTLKDLRHLDKFIDGVVKWLESPGVGVFRLFSASILHFPSGYKQLQTVPALLPNNFPLGVFASECAPALSLESGLLKLRVKVKGTMLVLADEVNGEGTRRKRRRR